MDCGYSGYKFKSRIQKIMSTNIEVMKRNELYKFVVIPKQWIVVGDLLHGSEIEMTLETLRTLSINELSYDCSRLLLV